RARRVRYLAGALGAGLALASTSAALGAARPDSVLVQLRGPYSAHAAHALAARHGMTVLRQLPRIGWVELGMRKGRDRSQHRSLLGGPSVAHLDFAPRGVGFTPAFQPRDPFDTATINGPSAPLNYHWSHANFFAAWDRSKGVSAAGTPV